MVDFNLIHKIIIILDSYRNALEKMEPYVYGKKHIQIHLRKLKAKYGHKKEWRKQGIEKRYKFLTSKLV